MNKIINNAYDVTQLAIHAFWSQYFLQSGVHHMSALVYYIR
jgi:hypothetical protein